MGNTGFFAGQQLTVALDTRHTNNTVPEPSAYITWGLLGLCIGGAFLPKTYAVHSAHAGPRGVIKPAELNS